MSLSQWDKIKGKKGKKQGHGDSYEDERNQIHNGNHVSSLFFSSWNTIENQIHSSEICIG